MTRCLPNAPFSDTFIGAAMVTQIREIGNGSRLRHVVKSNSCFVDDSVTYGK